MRSIRRASVIGSPASRQTQALEVQGSELACNLGSVVATIPSSSTYDRHEDHVHHRRQLAQQESRDFRALVVAHAASAPIP